MAVRDAIAGRDLELKLVSPLRSSIQVTEHDAVTELPARKLAVLLHADVFDSNALVQAHAALAHQRILSCFQYLAGVIQTYGGTVHEVRGDALVAEFEHASDAVGAALAFQSDQAGFTAMLEGQIRPLVRIGISIGEVMIADRTITGVGVVMAQRLEQLAEPGGVVIQGIAHETISRRLPFDYYSLGDLSINGFEQAVRAYRVRLHVAAEVPEPDASPAHRVLLALPDKPSIAVLPFANMNDDLKQEYFSNGISEDIITALSRMPWFFVISRNSSFIYKGQQVDIRSAAEELGVQYVLEGSVRKSGEHVRVTAQLIDAMTDEHLWAGKYDRELADVFALQDEVVDSIVGVVAPEFLNVEARHAQRADPNTLSAWDCVMRGRWHMWKLTREHLAQARILFQRATKLIPGGEYGASDLAFTHMLEAYYSWTVESDHSMQDMMYFAQTAVAADDHDAWAHTTLGLAKLFALKWNEALASINYAIALSPNFAPARGMKCLVLACMGDSKRAIASFNKAVRLSPYDSLTPMWLMGKFWAHWQAKRFKKAMETASEFVQLAPENLTARRQLAAACFISGNREDARRLMQEYLELEPDHTAVSIRGLLPARNLGMEELFIDALCKAGLPR
jgi:adenylate cyclase